MDASIFLARFLGVYILVATLIWLIRTSELKSLAIEVAASKALLPFSGAIALMFGIAVLTANPYFELNYKGLITFVGLFTVFQGVIRLVFPNFVTKATLAITKGYTVKILLCVWLVIGVYLTWVGYR